MQKRKLRRMKAKLEIEREINKGINVEENEKKIAELEEKTNELEEKEIHGCRFKASGKGNYERYYGKRRRKFLSLLWRKFRQLGRSEATFMWKKKHLPIKIWKK